MHHPPRHNTCSSRRRAAMRPSAAELGVMQSVRRRSALRPIGVTGWGSIPLALVGSIALFLFLLQYVSVRLVLSANEDSKKEVPMVTTLTARARVFLSSAIETMWAIGVGGVVGHLSA